MNKAFKKIFQEEMIFEETKKKQHNYLTKISKLQKQLETTKKKSDQIKTQNLEAEIAVVSNLRIFCV